MRVKAIIAELSKKILGKSLPKFSCPCGCSEKVAVATSITPSGGYYPGQEMFWVLWKVVLICTTTQRRVHECGLSEFLPASVLCRLFRDQFGNIEQVIKVMKVRTLDYAFLTTAEARASMGMSMVCKVGHDVEDLRIFVHWGKEQEVAQTIYAYENAISYQKVREVLRSLVPVVIVGGPKPKLEYEPTWFETWEQVLSFLDDRIWAGVRFESIKASTNRNLHESTTIVFVK